MRTSVLGMGRMGQAIAIRLASAGHEVTVWNRSPGRAGPAVAAGATEAGSLEAALRQAEVAITMLANDDAVRAVALGEDGVARWLGRDAVYLDSSTVSPELAGELADRIERYLAMPVVGGPDAVRDGQAALFLGGPADPAGRAGPVVDALSSRVVRFERAPEALSAKLTGNFLLLCGLVMLAEAMEVGRAGGLDDAQLKSVFGESPLVAPGLRNRFENVLNRSTEGWFSMPLGAKDVALARRLASAAGVDLPVAGAVEERYEAAGRHGLDGADVAAVSRLYEPTR